MKKFNVDTPKLQYIKNTCGKHSRCAGRVVDPTEDCTV